MLENQSDAFFFVFCGECGEGDTLQSSYFILKRFCLELHRILITYYWWSLVAWTLMLGLQRQHRPFCSCGGWVILIVCVSRGLYEEEKMGKLDFPIWCNLWLQIFLCIQCSLHILLSLSLFVLSVLCFWKHLKRGWCPALCLSVCTAVGLRGDTD